MFVSLTHLLLDYGQVLDVGQVKSEHRHPHGDNASVIGGRRSSKNAQQRTHPSAMTLGKQKRVQIYPRRKHSPDAKTFTGRKTPIGRKNTHRTQEHPSDREEIIHLTSVKQNVSTDAPSNYRHHESRYVGQISSDCEHIPAAVSPVQATIIAVPSTVQTHPHQYPAFAYSPVIPTIDARSIR